MTANSKPLDLAQFEGYTPGPWRWMKGEHYYRLHQFKPGEKTNAVLARVECVAGRTRCDPSISDQELLAAAPALLAECRAQREQIKALRVCLQNALTVIEAVGGKRLLASKLGVI